MSNSSLYFDQFRLKRRQHCYFRCVITRAGTRLGYNVCFVSILSYLVCERIFFLVNYVYENNKLNLQKHKHTWLQLSSFNILRSQMARLIESDCGKHIAHSLGRKEKEKKKENRTIKYTRRYAVRLILPIQGYKTSFIFYVHLLNQSINLLIVNQNIWKTFM